MRGLAKRALVRGIWCSECWPLIEMYGHTGTRQDPNSGDRCMRTIQGLLAAFLLVTACSAGPIDPNSGSQSAESTNPAPVESTAPRSELESTTSTVPTESVPTTPANDRIPGGSESLVDLFVIFSKNPTGNNFEKLPLADSVDLGLGASIVKTVEAEQLRQPEAWQLDVELFRAYVGPFSAFDMLSGLAEYESTAGEHPHCASPPVPPPDGHASHERISVQPQLGPQDSCLMWSTVDFLLEPSGEVVAITLDMYEP